MLDLGGIKKNIGEIEERIVNERREKNRRQQQVVFLLDRIETYFQKQQEELNGAYQKIDRLESALQEIAGAVEKLAGQSKGEADDTDEVLEKVLDLDRKFHAKPDAAQRGLDPAARPTQAEHAVHTLPTDRTLVGKPVHREAEAGERSAAQQSALSPYRDPDYDLKFPAAVASDAPDREEAASDQQPKSETEPEGEAERTTAQQDNRDRPWEKPSFGAASEPSSSEPASSPRWSADRSTPEPSDADKQDTRNEPAPARPARPDFSPDIRAIKALLNREPNGRAGRESA